MRTSVSSTTLTSCFSSKSKCSRTDPARLFSMGIAAASTTPSSKARNTSAESAHGTISAPATSFSAASWLNAPGSPWIAIFMQSSSAPGLWPLNLHYSGVPQVSILRPGIPGCSYPDSRGQRNRRAAGHCPHTRFPFAPYQARGRGGYCAAVAASLSTCCTISGIKSRSLADTRAES